MLKNNGKTFKLSLLWVYITMTQKRDSKAITTATCLPRDYRIISVIRFVRCLIAHHLVTHSSAIPIRESVISWKDCGPYRKKEIIVFYYILLLDKLGRRVECVIEVKLSLKKQTNHVLWIRIKQQFVKERQTQMSENIIREQKKRFLLVLKIYLWTHWIKGSPIKGKLCCGDYTG